MERLELAAKFQNVLGSNPQKPYQAKITQPNQIKSEISENMAMIPRMSNRGVLILQNETPREQEALNEKLLLTSHDLLNRTHDQIRLKKIVKHNPDDSFFENLS